MKDIFSLILIITLSCALVYFAIKNDPVIITNKEYIKGIPDTLVIHDTIVKQKPIYLREIEYKIDTLIIRDSIYFVAKSTFRDSSKNHLLIVDAFAPVKVDSFNVDLSLYLDSIIINQTDTLKITETIESAPLWAYGVMGLQTIMILFK